MELNLENSQFELIEAPYPICFVNNFIDEKNCEKLYREVLDFSNYDDVVMSGRQRVNKGSKNFNNYLRKSPNLLSLYEKLNNKDFYLNMKNILDNLPSSKKWQAQIGDFKYSKEDFSEQSFDLIKYLRKTKIISNFFKKIVNLDMDFSKSKNGYFRDAHRDRGTRIISFLLYLNSIKQEDGGQFEVYGLKKNENDIRKLDRFPNKDSTVKLFNFPPKAGQLFFFTSTPNSYHGVSKFLSEKKMRVFIYGSYCLDRNVEWKNFGENN